MTTLVPKYDQGATGAVNRPINEKLAESVSVLDFGAKGDGQTDDLASFNLAKAAAIAGNKSIYIPATQYWYRLTDTFTLSGDSLSLYGEGVNSLLCIDNIAGSSCLVVEGTMCIVDSIGITGVAGSGHGFEVKTSVAQPTAQGRFNNIWVGWVGGDCFRVTKGQSSTFTSCYAMQNNGYRPRGNFQPSLPTPRTEGVSDNGFHVASEAGNNTNDQTFINCSSNSGAQGATTDYANLKIGTYSTTYRPQSVKWFGGLLQGGASGRELYISGSDCVIDGCHIEASGGLSNVYIAHLEGCSNVVIKNCLCNGDVLINGSSSCGLENVVGWGLNANDSTNSLLHWHQGTYGNVSAGTPTGGLIIDPYGVVDATGLQWAKDPKYSPNVNLLTEPSRKPFISTQFDTWVGGVPFAFTSLGGTLTQTAAFGLRTSGSVVELKSTAFNEKTLKLTLPPYLGGFLIYVEAWVYNLDESGGLYLGFSYPQELLVVSTSIGKWERITATFRPPSTSTASFLYFTTNNAKTAYINNMLVSINVDKFTLSTDLVNAVNDGAAAAAGVSIGENYRNGSVMMVRMA